MNLASWMAKPIASISLLGRQKLGVVVAQLLAQEQSQHMLELEPMVDRLHGLFLTLGDVAGMAQYKAMAILNERLHSQAAVLAYQECYLGLAFFYALLCIPVLLLHRHYTVPTGTPPLQE